MPKSVSARTHPCLTLLLMEKGSEEEPAIVLDGAFHFLVERSDHPQELRGHPILCRSVK